MIVTLILAVFAVTSVTAARIPKPPGVPEVGKCEECATKMCIPVMGCKDGNIGKDSCNCCDVCIKTKELAKCGGIMDIHGECGNNMVCHVRHPNSHENRQMMPGSKIGRCEKGQ